MSKLDSLFEEKERLSLKLHWSNLLIKQAARGDCILRSDITNCPEDIEYLLLFVKEIRQKHIERIHQIDVKLDAIEELLNG